MKPSYTVFYLLFLFVITSCAGNTEPRAINYGEDVCAYCKMTIMDPKFGAELITDKGKITTYDAAECLLNDLENYDEAHVMCFTTDYTKQTFVNSTNAYYLISSNHPSPMGANLSCHTSLDAANKYATAEKDTVLNWEGVKQHFSKK